MSGVRDVLARTQVRNRALFGMALSNAEKQKRRGERRNQAARNDPDTVEQALLQEVERFERGELSDEERAALAEKLADIAMDFLRRSQRFARMARKLSGTEF